MSIIVPDQVVPANQADPEFGVDSYPPGLVVFSKIVARREVVLGYIPNYRALGNLFKFAGVTKPDYSGVGFDDAVWCWATHYLDFTTGR